MGATASRRMGLAAVLALTLYALACWFPGAWSPDSTQVVLPVFGEEGIERLVMVDLQGRPVRTVAATQRPGTAVGPASWSPDGRRIAYMRFEGMGSGHGPDAKPRKGSLVIQEAATGRERIIWTASAVPTGADQPDKDVPADVIFPPRWHASSEALAVLNMNPKRPGLLVLDMQGQVRQEIALASRLAWQCSSLSPDGRWLAYLEPTDEDQAHLMVHEVERGTGRKVFGPFRRNSKGPHEWPVPPAWSPDSQWLYFVTYEEKGEIAAVQRLALQTAKTAVLWKRPACVLGMGVSARSGLLVLDYGVNDLGAAIDVVNPTLGQAVPIHFEHESQWGEKKRVNHYSTSISPDGRWVALCPFIQDQDSCSVGLIVSSDGRTLRFFVPDPARASTVASVIVHRVAGALHFALWKKLVDSTGVMRDGRLEDFPPGMENERQVYKTVIRHEYKGVEDLDVALDLLTKVARECREPVFQEAAVWGPLVVYLNAVAHAAPDKRPAFVAHARALADDLARRYPDHPFGPALREELERMLEKSPSAQTAPEQRK